VRRNKLRFIAFHTRSCLSLRSSDLECRKTEIQDPADLAQIGFDAMIRGDGDIVSGWKNKVQSAVANVTPAGVLAEQYRKRPSQDPQKSKSISRRSLRRKNSVSGQCLDSPRTQYPRKKRDLVAFMRQL
jgi:hypothetical protein